ncbi:MAG: hypothetical protein ACXAC2_03690 [Candidatus Kariarchaeaceae archaeon]|jgi:hypothetical protein
MTIANTNIETGIRYGIIALNSLEDWVYDEFFNNGTDITYQSALKEYEAENPDHSDSDLDEFNDNFSSEESSYELETDGMKLGMSIFGGAYHVWVYESPVKSMVDLCSPCVPNCGNLDSKNESGFECYGLPEDWYRKEV